MVEAAGGRKREAEAEPDAEGGGGGPAAKAARPEAELPAGKAVKEEEEAELEVDAAPELRPRLQREVGLGPAASDTTINLVPTLGGRLLMPLSDPCINNLVAAARFDVGLRAGRHFFEVRLIEVLHQQADGVRRPPPGIPRLYIRIGFSLAGSSLFLGDDEGGVCFDYEGLLVTGGKRKGRTLPCRHQRDHVLGVLLNLDASSPNAHTISLFGEGKRLSEPHPLPEELRGKALFPHVSFRSVSLQVHFGPAPMAPLPFACPMVGNAALEDAEVAVRESLSGERHDVVFPVALPNQGTLQWVDRFLEKHPEYLEISDRRLMDWATRSGFSRPGGQWRVADKPSTNVGIGLPGLDEGASRRVLHVAASLAPRPYVVVETRAALLAGERAQLLRRFSTAHARAVARVAVGEPPEDFKEEARASLLKEKQDKLDAEFQAKQLERQRVQAAAAVGRKRAVAPEVKEEEAKEEAKKEEEQEELKEEGLTEVKAELDEKVEAPAVAELTEEEQKVWFKKSPMPEVAPSVLALSFVNFSIPEKKEGFEEIQYEWNDEESSKEYLRKWVREMKLMTRVEDLVPSEWFQNKLIEWHKSREEWQLKQKIKRDPRDALKKGAEVSMQKGPVSGVKAPVPPETDADLDVWAVENVCDVGDGSTLFADFTFEDWALSNLRFELYLLVQAFKRDVTDPDRRSMRDTFLPYYYSKYYKKVMNPRLFGCASIAELLALVADTVRINEQGLVTSELPSGDDDFAPKEMFLKLGEVGRRERQRRIDAGDETAKLKFSPLAGQISPVAQLKPGVGGDVGASPTRPGMPVAAAWKPGLPAAWNAWAPGVRPSAKPQMPAPKLPGWW